MTSITQNGETDIVYIQDSGSGTLQRKINNGAWTTISAWPVTITNQSLTTPLKILFTTDITLNVGVTQYFICNSGFIQFGSTSLNADGSRPNITIDNLTNYPGFIRNGTGLIAGQSNIYVYNIQVSATNGSTLADYGGWIGQEYFGQGATTDNYIVNCSSTGDITDFGGGIVGAAAGSQIGGTLILRGCSSSGTISIYAGGIAGHAAGNSYGSLTCENCWSTGSIGQEGGGICGSYAGSNQGVAFVENCYSTGSIGQDGGGICGAYAGESIGLANVQNCYSRGDIQSGGGGIFGANAGDNFGGEANATNSYSSGSIITTGTGIYGSNKLNGTETNCYAAEGNWSNTTANGLLQGVPGATAVGSKWIRRGIDQPYELNAIGYTPYSATIINSSSQLIQSFSETIAAGTTGSQAVAPDASGNEFTILQVTDGDSASYATITINSQTGALSTTSATVPGTYTITVRSIGSYNITIYILLVSEVPAPGSATGAQSAGCCQSETLVRDISYEWLNDYKIGKRLIAESNQNPKLKFDGYSEYVKYKMALGSGRI